MIQMDDFGVQPKLMKMERISGGKDFGVIVMINAIKGIYIRSWPQKITVVPRSGL